MSQYQANNSGQNRQDALGQASALARSPVGMLIAGMVVGLVVGLFYAWQISPTRWSSAELYELKPEAKADYLAAVAEAYVYSGSPDAAETARARLKGFGAGVAAEIEAAIEYFEVNTDRKPNARIHANNIIDMSDALGIDSGAAVAGEEGAAPDASSGVDDGVDDGAASSADGSNWSSWLLTLLAAGLLIAGGLYILRRMSERRTAIDEGGFDNDDDFELPPSDSHAGYVLEVQSTGATAAMRYEPMTQDPDYAFQAEQVDVAATGVAAARQPYGEEDEEIFDPEDYDEDGDEDEDGEDQVPVVVWGSSQPDTHEEERQAASGAVAASAASVKGTRGPTGQVIDHFRAHYHLGIVEYEESHSIHDGQGDRSIGDYGMGVNTKNGILQNNPEQVIALDVWLLDKRNQERLYSDARVLLSRYVVEHDLQSAFDPEKADDPLPLEAEQGKEFQIRAGDFLLDGRIVEVKYVAGGDNEGAFASVQVDMAVRSLT